MKLSIHKQGLHPTYMDWELCRVPGDIGALLRCFNVDRFRGTQNSLVLTIREAIFDPASTENFSRGGPGS